MLRFVSLLAARRADRRLLDLEFSLYLLAMFMVGPLAWEHHLVYVLPAILVAVYRFVVVGRSKILMFLVSLSAFALAWEWPLGHPRLQHGWMTLAASVKLYGVAIIWLILCGAIWHEMRVTRVVGEAPPPA